MGWAEKYKASEVARALQPGERVLLDGKRATFMLISDGKELYEFSLECPPGTATVDLENLDQRVKIEHWEEDKVDWAKKGEDFVRWLTSTGWAAKTTATVPVPPTVLQDALKIIRGLLNER
jgi:3-methyladenine DNA glycosylase AlkD